MAKMPAEEENCCIEFNKNVCKKRQITTVCRKKVSFRSGDIHSFHIRENIVFFSVQAEYSYFFADFRLKTSIFLDFSK